MVRNQLLLHDELKDRVLKYLGECKLNRVSERAYGSCFAVKFFYW